MPLSHWAISASQLKIIFADRMKTDLWIGRKKAVPCSFKWSRPGFLYYNKTIL
jgi:hypothetical protein